MQLPLVLSTGFILGSAVTMILSYLWLKYKVFKPYEKAVTQTMEQSQANLDEQSTIIKKQDAMIEEMNSLLKNHTGIKFNINIS